ncbi:MAG TPA: selenium-binding protein SBP56-related protein, partial [Acidimicrobiales bacterium]|nr:selenium-binding protein SBP56-related protein [Acidimicrobiales bacterium]
MSTTDPTFYPTPRDATEAAPEGVAYVAAFRWGDGSRPDALATVDVDPASADYGRVVGWTDMAEAGDELHHFGWNACSAALCHEGHHLP